MKDERVLGLIFSKKQNLLRETIRRRQFSPEYSGNKGNRLFPYYQEDIH